MQFLIFVTLLIASTMAHVSYLSSAPLEQIKTPLVLFRAGPQLQPQQLEQHQPQQLEQDQPQQLEQDQQYYNLDTLGQYAYGYSNPSSAKQETRNLDGITRGSYSYVDSFGILQTVDYTADDNGFHVLATNLPKGISRGSKTDVPYSKAIAPEQNLATNKAAQKGDYSSSGVFKRVEDNAKVTAAKKESFARYSAEQEKQNLLQKNALLKSQSFLQSPPAQYEFTGFKSTPSIATKPIVQYVPCLRTPIVPVAGVITYGNQLGSAAIKPQRYYLPVA